MYRLRYSQYQPGNGAYATLEELREDYILLKSDSTGRMVDAHFPPHIMSIFPAFPIWEGDEPKEEVIES